MVAHFRIAQLPVPIERTIGCFASTFHLLRHIGDRHYGHGKDAALGECVARLCYHRRPT